MKSLSVGMVCFPSFGGSGVVATELATGLAKRGHRVHVLASAPPFRTLPSCDRLFFHEISVPTYPLLDHAPYALAVASALVEVFENHGLDLIHTHYAMPHAASAYLAHQILGARAPRIITTLHGTDVTHIGKDPNYLPVTRFTVQASHGVTTPSQFLKTQAYQQLGLPEHMPIAVLSNFVDTTRYSPPETRSRKVFDELFASLGQDASDVGSPVLCHVSNFRAVKRTTDLIDVLEQVRRVMPARLVLVGDGPERTRATQYAKERGVHAHVCFVGKRADFADTLSHADVFVLPSESESFGLAALEALSSGVPVIGYAVGGLPEVVGDDAGILVPPYDIDALAHATLTVLRDPTRRDTLGAAARKLALTRFEQDEAVARYERYYHDVLTREAT